MTIALSDLLRALRRWWWLLPVLPVLGAVAGFALASIQAPRFDATATVLVTPAREPGVLAFEDLQSGSLLAQTYAHLATSDPVLDGASEALGEPTAATELRKRVSARIVRELPLIEIVASAGQPDRAAALANAVAGSLTERIQADAAARVEPGEAAVTEEIATVQATIDQTAAQIQPLDPNTPGGLADRDELRRQLEQLQSSLEPLETTAAAMEIRRVASEGEAMVWAEAAPPVERAAPRPLLLAVLGGLAGAMVGGAAIVLRALVGQPARRPPVAPASAAGWGGERIPDRGAGGRQ